MTLRAEICSRIAQALAAAVESGELPQAAYPAPAVEEPKNPEHGDFACSIALMAAKAAGENPRNIAEALAARLRSDEAISAADVAGPGFLNLRLDPAWVGRFALSALESAGQPVLSSPAHFARTAPEHPLGINVEFVSVNPNGPITIGSGRGAAYGSTLCNVLAAAGHTVHREYYINDGVNSEQMRLFAVSIRSYIYALTYGEWRTKEGTDFTDYNLMALIEKFALEAGKGGRSKQTSEELYSAWIEFARRESTESGGLSDLAKAALENSSEANSSYYSAERPRQIERFVREAWSRGSFKSPTESRFGLHYRGDYVFEAAKKLVDAQDSGKDGLERWESAIWDDGMLMSVRKECESAMISIQREGLNLFGVHFDTWFSEQSLVDQGVVHQCIEELEAKGAADAEPHRVVVKTKKGGAIETVEHQLQAKEEDDTDNRPSTNDESGQSPTLWLRSTKFGDDMDRVLRRRDGRLTYISSDVAYHRDKFNRPEGADRLITILGPDHHGYIGRLQAVVAAMRMENPLAPDQAWEVEGGALAAKAEDWTEHDALIYRSPQEKAVCQAATAEARERLHVQIYQLVRFLKDGKPAPMRKRDGNIYALIDLIREIGEQVRPTGTQEEKDTAGKDVARFFYLMRHHDTTFDFDLDLAARQSDENPVFYVQYAHARICSVIERAAREKLTPPTPEEWPALAVHLAHDREKSLLIKALDLPEEIARCAEDYAVSRLATYAIELARSFHHFYDACRVADPEAPELSRARLGVCVAARTALQAVLEVLGVSAPERMDRAQAQPE